MISDDSDAHARIAALAAQLSWHIGKPDSGELIAAIEAGPPALKGSERFTRKNFDLYRMFVFLVAQSPTILDGNAALVWSLLWNRWISHETQADLKDMLVKNGQQGLVEQAEQSTRTRPLWDSFPRHNPDEWRKSNDAMNLKWRRLLASIASMGDGFASYLQLREMSEITGLIEAVVPSELPANTSTIYELLDQADSGREAFHAVCVLGGLDTKVVSAQAQRLRDYITIWDAIPPLYYASRVPILSNWPQNPSHARKLLATLVRMASADRLSCHVACLGLKNYPQLDLAIRVLEEALARTFEWKSRYHLAWTILSTEEPPMARARDWMRGGDAVLARCAALFATHAYVENQADVLHLKEALMIRDSKIRLNVRRLLEQSDYESSSEIDECIKRGEGEVVGWSCMGCGESNKSTSPRCAKCGEDI
jgi:hypothetical protein